MPRLSALLLGAATLITLATGAATPALAVERPSHGESGLSKLPVAARAVVSGALGRDSHAFQATDIAGGLHIDNRLHGLSADFRQQGIVVKAGAGRLALNLERIGYGSRFAPVESAQPESRRNRVEYRRGALTEWYVNGPLGLEQGFILRARPGKPSSKPLTLALALSGTLRASLAPGAKALDLTIAGRRAPVRYNGLAAWDATGRALPAWLALRDGMLLVHVRDAGARYPLTIDPTFQQAKLTASDGAEFDTFGKRVAISGDVIVVGAADDEIGGAFSRGSAYVFVKPGGGWATATQTAKLTASDGVDSDFFGASVAISGDTIVVGANGDDFGGLDERGSAYVFVKPGGGWTNATQTAKLTASDGAGGDSLGVSVGISGNTVIVGAFQDQIAAAFSQGSAYIYIKPAGPWVNATQTAKLTSSNGEDFDFFGESVSISGDTAVVGARFGNGVAADTGAAYVYVKPAGPWVNGTETAKLSASDGVAGDAFGGSVSIGGDTVAVGASADEVGENVGQGSAYVFVKPSGGWATGTQTAKLNSSGGGEGDSFGSSVSVSGDTIVVGASSDDVGSGDEGAAYVFVKPGGGWTSVPESAQLAASDGELGDTFGESVSISGSVAVVGASGDDIGSLINRGSAYVFTITDLPPPGIAAPQISAVAEGTEVGVFGRNLDNELWYRETTSGAFGAWTKLSTATNVASRPKAVMVGPDLYVFFRSTANDLRYFKRTGGTWGSEQNLGGVIAGSPAAAVDGDGDLIVAARNGTGLVFFNRLVSGGGWTGFGSLDGILAGQLELVTYASNVHLFGVNPSGLFWDRLWSATPNSWGAWTPLDGVLASSPAAAVLGSDLYVFGRNPDGILFYRELSGGTFGPWTALDGVLSGTPDAAATASTLLVFGTNPVGSLWDRRTTGGAFTAWDPLDGILATGPEAVAVGTQTYVFALNPAGILWYRLWNGASFGAWTSLDGVLGTE